MDLSGLPGHQARYTYGMEEQANASGTPDRLLPAQRQLQLAGLLQGTESVALDALARRFGVSTQTIRRDLIRLEQQGLVKRTYGGAITREALDRSEPAFVARFKVRSTEKHAIARLALTLVRREETLFLDASTTALALAQMLPDEWAGEVIVTSLPAAIEIARRSHVRLTVVGGEFRHSSRSFGGPLAEQALQDLCVTTAFISARGIHPQRGLTEANASEAAIKRIVLPNAERAIALIDSSKIGIAATHRFAPLSAIDMLITDVQAPPDLLQLLRTQRAQVLIADPDAPS